MGICESNKNQGCSNMKNAQIEIANPYNQRNINTYQIGENYRYLNNNKNNIITKEPKINIIDQVIPLGNVPPIKSMIEDKINKQMKKYICKIYLGEKFGTGFLCLYINLENNFLHRVLITNKSFISEEQLLEKEKISIFLDKDKEERTLYLRSERKIYSSKKYDVTFIELLPGEYMKDDYLIQIDDYFLKCDIEEQKKKNNIYIIQYIDEIHCIKAFGKFYKIKDNYIYHKCTQKPGGPILSLDTGNLIGINIGKGEGILIKEPLEEFYKIFREKKGKNTIKNCLNCYYIIKNEEEFNLLHDYNNNTNEFVFDYENIDLKEKKKFIEDTIDIYVNSQFIPFNYKYKTNYNKIHVKFIFKKILNDLSFMFFNCKNLESINLSSYDMTNITDMKCMFSGCTNLKYVDLTSLNTNNDIDLAYMFSGCLSLISFKFPSFEHKINVTNLACLFFNCSSIEEVNLSSLNTIKVKDMNRLFSACHNIKTINISSFRTDNVTDMRRMFAFCTNLKSIDLSHFETKNVEVMNDMFFDCRSLITLDLSSFNTINVINMSNMFAGCESLKFLDLSSFKTPKLVGIDFMLSGCTKLESIDMSNFSTSNVRLGAEMEMNTMVLGNNFPEFINTAKPMLENIFYGCQFLKTVKCNDRLILDMFNKNKEKWSKFWVLFDN